MLVLVFIVTSRSRDGSLVRILEAGRQRPDDRVFSGPEVALRVVGGGDGGRVVRRRHTNLDGKRKTFLRRFFVTIFWRE